MVVRTNVFALNAHRNLKNVGTDQARASQRLSSGFRVNSASDDAAGLAISESMRAQIRGLDQASRNTQDGQALVQTAEGGLQEIQNMMQRIRELAVQAANDTNTAENRGEHIALEVWNLNREITDISQRVEFNGMRILDSLNPDGTVNRQSVFGSDSLGGGLRFQVGANENQLMFLRMCLDELQSQVAYNISDNGPLDDSQRVSVFQAIVGTLNHVALAMEGAAGYNSILGTWFNYSGLPADEIPAGQWRNTTGTPVGDAVWDNVGASLVAGPAGRAVPGTGDVLTPTHWISHLIGQVDHFVNLVSNMRAELGAVYNRLEYTMRSLDISSENLSDAESRVRNADMAREMMAFTMANVLQQASVSMLAQANQLPNNLLQLLR
jgi:flagellin